MNSKQHRLIAQWHIEQAKQHDLDKAHSCGCPIEHASMTNSEILKVMKEQTTTEG